MREFDVLAIGELNVDMIMTGLKSMPVIGRELIAKDCSVVLGSSTAICACGISKLGLKTGFIGTVGKDSFGEVVLEGLEQYGIDLRYVNVSEEVKTGITVSLSTERDRALVSYLGSIDYLSLENIDLELLKSARHIHIGSYFLQSKLRPSIPEIFKTAKSYGVTTSLDSGWDDTENWDYGIWEALKYTDIFFPNEIESLNITKSKTVEQAAALLSEYCDTVVVKCGSKGAMSQRGNMTIKKQTYDLKAIDTTGAGDSFNAGYIYAFLNGLEQVQCLEYGNACGSISVTKIGGASSCASLEEVKELVRSMA